MVLIEAQINGLKCIASDNVPKTTQISKEITYLSLSDKSKWLEEMQKQKSNHVLKYNKLKNDYDIKIVVKKLEKIYLNEG